MSLPRAADWGTRSIGLALMRTARSGLIFFITLFILYFSVYDRIPKTEGKMDNYNKNDPFGFGNGTGFAGQADPGQNNPNNPNNNQNPGYGQAQNPGMSQNPGYGQAQNPGMNQNTGYGQAQNPGMSQNSGYGQTQNSGMSQNLGYGQSQTPNQYGGSMPNPGYGQTQNTGAAPNLTLDPFSSSQPTMQTPPSSGSYGSELQQFDERATLTPEEQRMVDDFARQIDITDTTAVMQYGAGAQQKIASFSDSALDKVKTQDLGEVGQLLGGMVTELRKFDVNAEDRKGFKFFKKQHNKIEALRARYAEVDKNIGKICDVLEGHQVKLMKDIATMDQLYDINLNYYKELSMYIVAGKQKLQQVRTTDLPRMVEKSKMTGLPEDIQAASDLASMCDRFDKKLHDLELTRVVAMQMAPQIRMIQNNDTLMAEKIQSSLVNTIPLWKSQMVIALGVAHATEAAKAQRQVTDMTNELLRKNAETLKINTIETARESERSIIDIETLKQTNRALISSFDEVLKIQEDGRARRAQAEVEIKQIENELKQKLIEVSQKKL